MEETQSIYKINDFQSLDGNDHLNQMNEIDDKTYSLVRKTFEGLGLILANFFTFGLINTFTAVQMEYEPVFGISFERLFCCGCTEQAADNHPVENQLLEDSEESGEEESQELLPTFDLSKIFPLELTNEANIGVFIPQTIENSLAILFGIEDVVNKLPVCQKIGDAHFSVADMPYPVMKVCDLNDIPSIVFKLKVADPQAYMDNIIDEEMIRNEAEKLHGNEIKLLSVEMIIASLKLGYSDKFESQVHLYSLTSSKNNPLFWFARIKGTSNHEPAFFENFTYSKTGNLASSAEAQMPEFQKLFKGDGIATDPNGNKWKLAVD